MSAISQTVFSDAFSLIKSLVFFNKISLNFVPKGFIGIRLDNGIGLNNGLVPNRRQAII